MSCRSAYSEYDNKLTKKKENTTTNKNNEKRKEVFEQITESNSQKMSLENCNEKMEKYADKHLNNAEIKQGQLLVTGNKLLKAVKVNIAKFQTFEAEIQNLAKKLKEMPVR